MITRLWLKNAALDSQKIPLIKEYRECMGKTMQKQAIGSLVKEYPAYNVGLKEAKDAIETCQNEDGSFNYRKLVVLFTPWLPVEPPIGVKPLSKKQQIQRAIGLAWDKWAVLGYANPYDAMRAVIANYEK